MLEKGLAAESGRSFNGSHRMSSPAQETSVAPRRDMNRSAPGRAVKEGKMRLVVGLTWVSGSGASTIQLSNLNYLIISTMNSSLGYTYSDSEFALFV